MTDSRRLVWVSVAFAVITAIMTWPLAGNAGSVLPDNDDAYFNVWRLAWVAHQLPTNPSKLFDANIFYPAHAALTFSDAMLLLGAVTAPAVLAGMHPVLAHNLLLLAAFTLSGVGAFVLTRHITGATTPALLAGIIFAFAPYKFGHIAHLELQWTAWMPLALWALHRLVESGQRRFGAFLGAFVALEGLCSLYYLAFFCAYLIVTTIALAALRRPQSWRKLAGGLCLAGVIAGMSLAPYIGVYQKAHLELDPRGEEEVIRYSASPSSYWSVMPDNRLYPSILKPAPLEELSLFPGAVAVGLAAIALWPPVSRVAAVYVGSLLFSFLASLGPHGGLFPLMRAAIPGLEHVRAPARFGVLVLLSLAVLAAIGSARLLARTSRKTSLAIAMALIAVCLTEYFSAPLRLRQPILDAPLVDRWLAAQPPGTVVLALPVPDSSRLWLDETTHEYLSIYHWQPLVNGYSGFAPLEYVRTLELLRTFPDDASIQRLRSLSVSYVMISRSLYEENAYEALIEALSARSEFEAPMMFPDRAFSAVVFPLRTSGKD